ncbi:MAG: DUF1761 domain-containing protein [Patescibacteria group bacterium]|nr:DUF1761 family protein [Patescibacteria group bacterium]MDE1941029.1 DUF1761 domain-containing protein [Patescibacteria group bacterium]MDE1966716.1 DUF1761 domain-containing protein [Patescibacteria group bacterium]
MQYTMTTVNFWPILIATIAAFLIGAVWYSWLFAKEWAELTGATAGNGQASAGSGAKPGVWKSYVSQFVITLIQFAVLGFLIAATGTVSGGDGAFFGFIVWLGFLATHAVSGMLWDRRPLKLILIESVGSLVSLIVGGAIIGAWQ